MGCRIEERLFETLPRMLACTAIYMIVTWRTLFTCRSGAELSGPELRGDFRRFGMASVWSVTHRGEPLPTTPPKLCEMIRLIMGLGGYLIRPNRKTPPGVETVWKGLQRMRVWTWEPFRPAAKPKRKLVWYNEGNARGFASACTRIWVN